MAKTESVMIPIGTIAPDFDLPDTISGNKYGYNEIRGKNGSLIAFICNHCPYVIHIRETMAKSLNQLQKMGIGTAAISSNDIQNYPDDSPENMKELGKQIGFEFPYLFDETQSVAKAYSAACTPDFFLFDKNDQLFYRGQFDGARPGNNVEVTGESLMAAADSMLKGDLPPDLQLPSLGCNIKWK